MSEIRVTDALEIGKAAEYLVCAEAILSGYRCFPTDQGLPYDLILDTNGKLYRVQVKATLRARCVVSAARRTPNNDKLCYSFAVRRRGRGGGRNLTNSQCDLVAMVALDIKVIAWMPVAACGQTVQLSKPGHEGRGNGMHRLGLVTDFSLERAMAPDFQRLEKYRYPRPTHCNHGHEFNEINTGISDKGYRYCRACQREAQAIRRERARAAL